MVFSSETNKQKAIEGLNNCLLIELEAIENVRSTKNKDYEVHIKESQKSIDNILEQIEVYKKIEVKITPR